ncbi:hypothetical protein [Microcoleus sp. MOSTC5]|uniref:hypothetical protein n=1 Tax=Microcoleus sp. MOSTC5 TaxID=3055378 RepID=UPI002FD6368B
MVGISVVSAGIRALANIGCSNKMETIKAKENNHTDNRPNLVDNILLMFVPKTLVIG